jgi:DNA-binding NarL/FixJ family response regulator
MFWVGSITNELGSKSNIDLPQLIANSPVALDRGLNTKTKTKTKMKVAIFMLLPSLVNSFNFNPEINELERRWTMNGNETEVSLLIATPHAMSRELLIEALKRHTCFHVVDSAITAEEAIKVACSSNIDVALISATLADGPLSGFGALRRIHECRPDVKSVILHDGREQNLVVDAFRAGARGVFSLSQSNFTALCRCVEQVHAGQIWANSSELSEVIEVFSQLAPLRVVNADGVRLLTKREEGVVQLVAEGLQNREIARELKLSEHTIKNYLFRIFDKLGVSSRVELALYAVSSTKRAQAGDAQADRIGGEVAEDPEIGGKFLPEAETGAGAQSSQSSRRKLSF